MSQVASKRHMASILTNGSALGALRSLTESQEALAGIERQVSTGLAVSTAADNAAYWSIAAQLKSDSCVVSAANQAIAQNQSALSTAATTIAAITSTINMIATALTQAANPGANLSDVNTTLSSLGDQLTNAFNGASFNGLNLLDGSQTAQLDFTAGFTPASNDNAIDAVALSPMAMINAGAGTFTAPDSPNIDDAATIEQIVNTPSNNAKLGYGSDVVISIAGKNPVYTVVHSHTGTSTVVAKVGVTGMVVFESQAPDGAVTTKIYSAIDGAGNPCSLASAAALQVSITTVSGRGLLIQNGVDLTHLMVFDASDAQTKLAAVSAAQIAVAAYASRIGAAQDQLTAASDFNNALATNYATGISALVDADMNQASSRLQALQTQQQLGIRSLSIANQNARLILMLFP